VEVPSENGARRRRSVPRCLTGVLADAGHAHSAAGTHSGHEGQGRRPQGIRPDQSAPVRNWNRKRLRSIPHLDLLVRASGVDPQNHSLDHLRAVRDRR
jgi:hypothetical protein